MSVLGDGVERPAPSTVNVRLPVYRAASRWHISSQVSRFIPVSEFLKEPSPRRSCRLRVVALRACSFCSLRPGWSPQSLLAPVLCSCLLKADRTAHIADHPVQFPQIASPSLATNHSRSFLARLSFLACFCLTAILLAAAAPSSRPLLSHCTPTSIPLVQRVKKTKLQELNINRQPPLNSTDWSPLLSRCTLLPLLRPSPWPCPLSLLCPPTPPRPCP